MEHFWIPWENNFQTVGFIRCQTKSMRNANEKFYENKGIPVHIELNYPSEGLTLFCNIVNDLGKTRKIR